MLTIPRIRREYREAGSVNSLVALWGFVDEYTFLTKAGHVGLVYRLAGVDDECLGHDQRREVVHRFESAVRLLDDQYRIYEYLCKRRIDAILAPACSHPVVNDAMARRIEYLNARRRDLYEIDLYLVLLYEGLTPRWTSSTRLQGVLRHPSMALQAWLSGPAVLRLLDTDLNRAVARLQHIARAFEVQLSDSIRPTPLPKAEAFRFFRRLVNYTPGRAEAARLRYDTHLDYFIADCAVECHRTHLDVDTTQVKVLTMKEPPAGTFAHVLEDLHAIPGEFIACLEWQRMANDRMRRDIQTRRRHFFNKRIALVNYVSSETRPEDMLVDESAGATVRQLGDALTELEVHGHFFGECSLTLVVYDEEPRTVERSAAEAMKVLAAHDGSLIDETYNLLNAWVSIVPGNGPHNVRRLALLETNFADLSFLFTFDRGQRQSAHLHRDALATFETRHDTPYFFNLHVDDVGHTVVLGATGSGKSFALNFLVTHAQQYDPQTVIFDLGHSYRTLATVLQGSYLEIGLRSSAFTINPFALPPTLENLDFLHAFTRVLAEGTDAYRLSDAEDRELYDAIENVYVLDPPQRRLFTLANLLPRALSGRLSKWIDGGRYATLFDNVDDTFSVQRFQVFDFDAMRAYPAVLEPLLFYVLHRVTARVCSPDHGPTLKLCVMDEAWRFIQHERLRSYVEEALKTWRKHNAVMLLATQSIEDFASSDLLRTVVESCPTKLLLANPSLDRQQYADLFQLNAAELDLLITLQPRKQLLMKRPGLAKVLTLTVDPTSYWIYTNTPGDNERVAAMVRDHGLEGGLSRLATLV
jgi:type IV secretion system protein TrbE